MNAPRFCVRLVPFVAFLCAQSAVTETHDCLGELHKILLVESSQGWGSLGLDKAAGPPDGRLPFPLQIGETVYEHGIGHHAPGDVVFALPGGTYTAFTAEVGVHWQGGGKGSVVFQVHADGNVLFDSGVMTDSDPPKSVNVPLAGVRELRLVSGDAGDGISCDMADWANTRLLRDPTAIRFEEPSLLLGGAVAPTPSAAVTGFSLIANEAGPQVATLGERAFAVCVRDGEVVEFMIPVVNATGPFSLKADVDLLQGAGAEVGLSVDGGAAQSLVLEEGPNHLGLDLDSGNPQAVIRLFTRGGDGESLVRWRNLQWVTAEATQELPALPQAPGEEIYPPPVLPALRPAMESMLVEWDWQMQDGIGTEREAVRYAVAIERTLSRGDRLLQDLQDGGVVFGDTVAQWQSLHGTLAQLKEARLDERDPAWERLWRLAHGLRRQIALANPLADVGPLAFVKHVSADMSHQLTQYYGRCARPGGGLFLLERPGHGMSTRQLAGGQLPEGSYMQPEVSFAGDRILFAFCEVSGPMTPKNDPGRLERFYHLFEIRPDGSGLRQLTEGPYNDFAPKELPNGKIIFISTRRGGFHRCGAGPCDVYTLAIAEADGSSPRTVSYHETQEWDPAVLDDGRVIYTRWDYVDRNAVHYQQLWTTRPDGSSPLAYYGNNTLSPVGVWEARQVPGSSRVMATAAAHHAMTAGSIILLDTSRGIDGPAPITRLTPDAPFPESETYVLPNNWHAPGSPKEYVTPEEEKRWPGHCYRSPWPLSEDYFLAAYSFDALIGEPDGNKANMFGLYLIDAFGNKELLYRDLNIASQWPVPLRPRPRPHILPESPATAVAREGTFFVQDVYQSNVQLPPGSVKGLRILQVLPKTTPNANNPSVGLANASPGKQVLGTVPVEPDGSAYFRAPSGIPLSFQALDERGQAIHIMRSITYLQPGEQASCVGCHEDRMSAPQHSPAGMALGRSPSIIKPGPDGSKPLSYPILVQPVLDRHCVSCHGAEQAVSPDKQPLVLTGAPEGHYTKSYAALAKLVPYSAWGPSLEANSEPAAQADRFGARASSLMKMLLAGHEGVQLDDEEIDRLVTWMDSNALFYGTFAPEDQARQLRGERIEGPALE